jgi:MFS transporter, FSR family, fosmidomycin resistance protein
MESSAQVETDAHRRRKFTLAACCGIHGVQDGLSAALYVILPTLAEAFGLSYAQVGIIRAAKSSAMTLFELPSGMLSERLGERALLVFGLFFAGFGYLALAVAPGVMAIALSLFIAGFGSAFQHALCSSIISNTFKGAGSRTALGVYNSAGDIGKLAFTALYSLAIGAGLAWQGVVTGFGLVAVLGAVALFFILRRLHVGSRPSVDAQAKMSTGSIGWGIRDRTGFTALAVIVFLDIAVQSGFLTFLAFLMLQKQVPAGLAALAVVLTLAGGIFGKFGCGFLAERIGVRRSLVIVECLTAAGIVAILVSPTLVAYVLLPVLGSVLQGSSSITYATVSDLVRADRRSRGFAAIYSIAGAASIAGPIIFGVVGDRLGLTPAMLAMAVVVLLPLPLSALLRPTMTGKYAA